MNATQKKNLSSIFKALHKVTAGKKDPRAHLERVSVTRHEGGAVRLEATDCARLVRATVPQSLVGDLAAGRYDGKRCAALLTAGAEIAPEPDDGTAWPNFDAVMPAKNDEPGVIAHYNAGLLAETIAVVGDLLVAAECDRKTAAVRVQMGTEEISPCRLDGVGVPDAEVVAVIMPQRV